MSELKLRVKVDAVVITVDKNDFQDAWDEKCNDEADGDSPDNGSDWGDPSDEFVIERVQEEFDDGNRDLSEAFDSAPVEVEKAE